MNNMYMNIFYIRFCLKNIWCIWCNMCIPSIPNDLRCTKSCTKKTEMYQITVTQNGFSPTIILFNHAFTVITDLDNSLRLRFNSQYKNIT